MARRCQARALERRFSTPSLETFAPIDTAEPSLALHCSVTGRVVSAVVPSRCRSIRDPHRSTAGAVFDLAAHNSAGRRPAPLASDPIKLEILRCCGSSRQTIVEPKILIALGSFRPISFHGLKPD